MNCGVNKIVLCLIIGVIVMSGCTGNMKYEKYSSSDPELSVAMEYISGWVHRESRGARGSYASVQFIGPKTEMVIRPYMSVSARNESKVKFKPLTIEAMAESLVSGRLKFQDSKVISRSSSKVQGLKAIRVKLEYKALDKLHASDAKLVPVKEYIYILKKGNKFYTLKYFSGADDFKSFESAFIHCVKTLRFK